jgi:hypothetical protein
MTRITRQGARFRFTPEYLAQQGGPIAGIPAPQPSVVRSVIAQLEAVRRDMRNDGCAADLIGEITSAIAALQTLPEA